MQLKKRCFRIIYFYYFFAICEQITIFFSNKYSNDILIFVNIFGKLRIIQKTYCAWTYCVRHTSIFYV